MARADMYDIQLAEAQGVELEEDGPRPLEELQHIHPYDMTEEEHWIWYHWLQEDACRRAYGVCPTCDRILSRYRQSSYCPHCQPDIKALSDAWDAGRDARLERARQRRIAKLKPFGGPKCHRCGKTEEDPSKIHFHHKEGAVFGGRNRRAQEREIREHPEMFELLCVACHGASHRGDPAIGGRPGWSERSPRFIAKREFRESLRKAA